MRQALGGDAALDAVKSLSMRAIGTMSVKGLTIELDEEVFLVLPDHYLRVRRLMPRFAESASGAQMFEGFRGAELIRATSRRTLPPSMGGDADRLTLLRWRHDAARLVFALLGTSLPEYPLEFSAAGIEHVGDETFDLVDARGPGGVVMRLHVDQRTHLPAMVTTTGLERVPESRWLLTEFKRSGAVNWPRKIEQLSENVMQEMLTVKEWKVNPPIERSKFYRIK